VSYISVTFAARPASEQGAQRAGDGALPRQYHARETYSDNLPAGCDRL